MSTVTKPILLDETFSEKLDTQNALLAGILEASGGSIKPTSWAQVQALVRAGLASKVFHIGDQLMCNRGTNTIVWDIIGIDHDIPADPQYSHSMTLQLHDCYNTAMQFDAKEAFYYAVNGLPAGTYHLKLEAHPWVPADVGKNFQFVLTQAVPTGGQIVFNQSHNVSLIGATVSTYASATSTTPIESATMSVGTGGISLGNLDNTVQEMINSIEKSLLGNNNYAESAIRQWLNSAEPAGSVWTPQTHFDRPPSWDNAATGWMYGLDADFLTVVGTTVHVAGANSVNDKFYLLSRREVYGDNEISSAIEGEPYPYYSDYADLGAPGLSADSNRIKYRNGALAQWWLRTGYLTRGTYNWFVDTDGSLTYISSSASRGIAPACNII